MIWTKEEVTVRNIKNGIFPFLEGTMEGKPRIAFLNLRIMNEVA